MNNRWYIMKRFILLAILIILATTYLTSCYLLPQEEESLEPPLLKPAQVEYVTEVVVLSDISKELIVRGKFRPDNEVTLSFEKRGGILFARYIKLGDKVVVGDLLLELDIDDMEYDKTMANYQYKKAKYRYESLKSKNASYYDLKIAAIDKDIANINYERIIKEIEQSKMYATIDGIVTYMTSSNIGDYVNAEKKIVKIADENALRLTVKGDDAYKFDFGDTVDIEVTIKRDKFVFIGEVVLSPRDKPENTEESFDEPTTIISIKNLDIPNIKINQEAKITLVEQSSQDVIVIHRNRIKNYFGRTFIYLLEDGIKVERDVKTGIKSSTMVEIIEGLKVGDVVIVR